MGTDPGDYTRGTKWLTEFFGVGSEKRCCRASGAVDGRDKKQRSDLLFRSPMKAGVSLRRQTLFYLLI